MHPAIAFFALMAFLAIGEVVSVKTKAVIPSILIFLILLLGAVWTNILPTNVIDLAGFSENLTDVIMVIIVVNMGSSLSVSDLKSEWKTVLIGIGAILGLAALLLTLGSAIYGWQTAVIAAPPLAGGFVAAFEMSKAALEKGLPHLSMIALLLLALQEFPVYFLLPSLLKKEANRNLERYRRGEAAVTKLEEKEGQKRIFQPIPEKYQSSEMYLFLLAVVGLVAILSSLFTKKIFNSMGISYSISPTIFALFYGVVAGEIGLLERKSLQKANAFGFFVVASLIGVMGGLVNHTPQEIIAVLVPIAVLIGIGIVGMGIGGIIVGKMLGRSWEMSFAIALNCLIGFPVNFLLTNEAINSLEANEEEKDYLTNTMVPTMLVGGFTTVTIGSVIFAGIIKNFL
ncbi:hypothetical protein [uncultured Clostridium sp.]|uniref:hypothetical protein n=1 Tax=uncultured Clostridium sp. TaxID=59620 RepID=UPI0028E867EA|nr:hypothetical protein [uncultured Clostridium sp.]